MKVSWFQVGPIPLFEISAEDELHSHLNVRCFVAFYASSQQTQDLVIHPLRYSICLSPADVTSVESVASNILERLASYFYALTLTQTQTRMASKGPRIFYVQI